MPSVLPTSGTYQLSVVKLKAGYTAGGITPGYQTVPSDKPQYEGEATYVLGENGNTIYQNALVTFGYDMFTQQNTVFIDYGNGKTQSFEVSNEYSSTDPSVVIVQNSSTVSMGTDHDWYMFANPTVDSSKYHGRSINHYFFPIGNDPDSYYLGNIIFTKDNIPANGGDGGSNGNHNSFDPCYLPGTRVRTSKGERLVETLKVGDTIDTLQHGRVVEAPICWVGKKRVKARVGVVADQAGYPVRIKKDALENGVPSQDLFITAEHSIYIDNVFIPIRMLVNGTTISYQYDIVDYDIYHIETRDHAIIWANDALSETYLDTGHRHLFENVSFLGSNPEKEWGDHAAAPLMTSRSIVEPIYQRLRNRAEHLGFQNTDETVISLTEDPGLFLITDHDETICPLRRSGDWWIFRLSSMVRHVILSSRTARPCDVIGPFCDDRRELGVLVEECTLVFGDNTIETDILHTVEEHCGWYIPAEGGACWTNGHGEMFFSDKHIGKGDLKLLCLKLVPGHYYVENKLYTSSTTKIAA